MVLQLFDGAAVGTASFTARFGDINFLSRIDLLSGPLANHLRHGQTQLSQFHMFWWLTYSSEKNYVNWDDYTKIYGKIKNVPNHQPVLQ